MNKTIGLPQTIVLTGATAGLGYACARIIAASHTDWHIVIPGRNRSQAARIVAALQRESGNQHIEWIPLDLASLASIRIFAKEFAARELPPLRALVCNAGLQVVSGTTYTRDGFETTFGVNCLGHFLLVNLLLRHLVAPARIVFVSSTTHNPERKKTRLSRLINSAPPRYRDPRALAWPERYPDPEERNESLRFVGSRRYSTSKLCDIFYAYELDRRLQAQGYSTPEHSITVNAFDPGTTPGTRLARDASAFGRFAWNVLLPALPNTQSPDTAGKALARLVLDPSPEGVSGKYFGGLIERASSRESYDQQKAAQLWDISAELVNLQPGETILQMGSSSTEVSV